MVYGSRKLEPTIEGEAWQQAGKTQKQEQEANESLFYPHRKQVEGTGSGAAPNDILLTARLYLPKQCHHLETKCSDTGACWGHSTYKKACMEPEVLSSAPHTPGMVVNTSIPWDSKPVRDLISKKVER